MINKQQDSSKETTSEPYNTIDLYNTTGSLSQYIVYNLFRILRPIRKKFNLTINEIVILNGMMLYNKYIGSSFSYSAMAESHSAKPRFRCTDLILNRS